MEKKTRASKSFFTNFKDSSSSDPTLSRTLVFNHEFQRGSAYELVSPGRRREDDLDSIDDNSSEGSVCSVASTPEYYYPSTGNEPARGTFSKKGGKLTDSDRGLRKSFMRVSTSARKKTGKTGGSAPIFPEIFATGSGPIPGYDAEGKSNSMRERERVQEWHQNLQETTEDIIIAEMGDQLTVVAGSKERLIERLTYEKYPDPRYMEAFLLTYRTFVTPLELLEGIISRYNIQVPEGKDPEAFTREKQTPIRLRAFLVLKTWIEKHFGTDFVGDETLITRLKEFLDTDMTNNAPTKSMATSLKNVLTKQMEAYASRMQGDIKIKPEVESQKAPCVPQGWMLKKNLFSFTTKTLAEHLSLIEFDLYRKIEPKECLHQGWNKKDKHKLAPNISAMIANFNFIAAWVSTEVVSITESTKRAVALSKFIDLSEELKQLGNFNAFTEVMAGLESTAVFRLKKTWELLTPESTKLYQTHKQLLDTNDNWTFLRNAMREKDLPCIPYLGVFLTDLTFIQDANTDQYYDSGLINFRKLSLIADVILQIQHYQETAYDFKRDDSVMDFFEHLDILNEKNLLEHSLALEPRKSKKPAVASSS